MGLLRKSGDKDKDGKGKRPKPPSTRTLIGPTVLMRIQAMVTAASGAARMPKSDPDSRAGSGYAQSLFNATPEKPKLKVLAIQQGDGIVTVGVGISTPNGAVKNEFTFKGELTEHNAAATARSIAATVFHQPAMVGICTRELQALVREQQGSQRVFTLSQGNRLMIESGEGG